MFEKDCDEAGAILRYRRNDEGKTIDFKQKADRKILLRSKRVNFSLVTIDVEDVATSVNRAKTLIPRCGKARAEGEQQKSLRPKTS